MAWDVMSGATKMAWDVMSRVTKTVWDVLSGVANLCGMFCPGCKKMARDVLSWDVLSGSRLTRIQIVFPGSDNFGSNPLYFSFCIKTLPDMSSADNLCKQFGPRSGPTFCSGLIGVPTV